jgi:integrase
LRYSSFDFKRNLLKINGNETKNKHTSYRVLPKILEKYFCFSDAVSDDPYLFSHNQLFTPGHKKLDSREFARYWNNFVRKNLKFPMEYKLYSLKDTGITNMLADGVPPIFVQGQADHSSIDITSIYTHNQTPEGFIILREVRDI